MTPYITKNMALKINQIRTIWKLSAITETKELHKANININKTNKFNNH